MMHNAHLPTVCVLVGVSAGIGWERYPRGEGILGTHSPSQDTYYLGYLTPPGYLRPIPGYFPLPPLGYLLQLLLLAVKIIICLSMYFVVCRLHMLYLCPPTIV